MEFLNLVIIFITAFLVLRAPQKERLAFRLLVTSVLLMMAHLPHGHARLVAARVQLLTRPGCQGRARRGPRGNGAGRRGPRK